MTPEQRENQNEAKAICVSAVAFVVAMLVIFTFLLGIPGLLGAGAMVGATVGALVMLDHTGWDLP